MKRRSFLASGLAATGAAGLLGLAPAACSATKKKPTNIRIALAAYSVREALTKTDYTLFKFIDWCAEMDLDGVELTSYYFAKDFDSAYLRRLRNHAFHNGLTISGTAIRNDFCKPAGPERDQEIETVKKWIDYAADLWAPHVRIFAGSAPQGSQKEEVIGWVAESVKQVLDHAEKQGVVIGLENHGGITAFPEDLLAICNLVGKHPYFGVNLDTGNFRRNPYEDLKVVAPLAVNVQIKIEVFKGETKVLADLSRFRDIILDAGYKGWVTLEYEGKGDPFKECPVYLRKLEKLFLRPV
ncbi:MAG TPA: sugar phosphate isomerase/epimerase family protein [bacterium]|nr:sugar phosphate isomerase/epimerase family protein [bacterium]